MSVLIGVLILFGVVSHNNSGPATAAKQPELSQSEASVWMGEIKIRKVKPEEISQ